MPGYRDNIGRIRQQPHDHRRARKQSHREQRSRRQPRQQPHNHRRVRKHSHREQRSRRQPRQQIPTVAERLCPGSRYSRCGRQIHLRKNPCHRQSRSNISWNKKSQILWMQNPLRISSLSIRILCRKRPRRKKVVPVSLQRETKRQMQPQKHRHHRKKIRRQSFLQGIPDIRRQL